MVDAPILIISQMEYHAGGLISIGARYLQAGAILFQKWINLNPCIDE